MELEIDLEINNFQLIKKGKLSFRKGLTIIQGSNSSGKTAILRSLRSLILNPSIGKNFIKHGETESLVTLNLRESNTSKTITWNREQTGVRYLIDSQVNTKCGRLTLFDLDKQTKFIYDDHKRSVLNICGEHDGLFPFDRSNTEIFKVFENIFAIEDSSAIITSITNYDKEKEKLKTKKEYEIAELEQKQKNLVTFQQKLNIESLETNISEYESLITQLEQINSDLETLNSIETFLSKIKFLNLEKFDISILENKLELSNDLKTLIDISLFDYKTRNLELKEFVLLDLENLLNQKLDMSNLNQLEFELNQYEKIKEIKKIELEDLENYLDIKTSKEMLKNISVEVKTILKNEKEYLSEIDLLKTQYTQALQDLKICPLCNQVTENIHM